MNENTIQHPNAILLKKMYGNLVECNYPAFLADCADHFTFQVAGKSPLAGKFTKETFVDGFAKKLQTISGGTFKLEVHDILAGDTHATILASTKVTRGDKTTELRTVHVWRFDQGKPIAGYEYPRDLYAFDALWMA